MTNIIININEEIMSFEQLDAVSGGAWGYHDIHNEKIYNKYGIATDWTLSPFSFDDFYYIEPGKETADKINSDAASAICYYRAKNDSKPTIAEALQYKAQDVGKYKEWLKEINR